MANKQHLRLFDPTDGVINNTEQLSKLPFALTDTMLTVVERDQGNASYAEHAALEWHHAARPIYSSVGVTSVTSTA